MWLGFPAKVDVRRTTRFLRAGPNEGWNPTSEADTGPLDRTPRIDITANAVIKPAEAETRGWRDAAIRNPVPRACPYAQSKSACPGPLVGRLLLTVGLDNRLWNCSAAGVVIAPGAGAWKVTPLEERRVLRPPRPQVVQVIAPSNN